MRETKYREAVYKAAEALDESGCCTFPVDFCRILHRYRNELEVITYGAALKSPELYGFSRDDMESFCGSRDGFTVQIACKYYIFINEKMPRLRKNFTFAHELGHVLLQHPCHINILAMTKEELYSPDGDYGSYEDEANAFARNLLCPVYAVKELLDRNPIITVNGMPVFNSNISEISEKFGISKDAAEVRLNLLQNDCYYWYGEW